MLACRGFGASYDVFKHALHVFIRIQFSLLSIVNIDECITGSDNCDDNADCTNVEGGFTCTCQSGYNGDGVTCAGERVRMPSIYHGLMSIIRC